MPTNRPARPADYPALQQIQTATLTEPVPSLLRSATEGTLPGFVREVQTGTETSVIGYVILVPDTETQNIHLPELAVHPEYQRTGHGSALVEHICRAFQEYGRLSLTVEESDIAAQQFYEAAGFAVVRELPEYFESGGGLLLHKELPG